MKGRPWQYAVIIAALLGLSVLLDMPFQESSEAEAGDFDYYLLAITWSPAHCIDEPRADRSSQCRSRPPHGFILHGLWPQYESGYPEFCESTEPRFLAERVIDRHLAVTPNKPLLIHQWRKHGMCTGLSQSAYFDRARTFYERVRLPQLIENGRDTPKSIDREALVAWLVGNNDGLSRDDIMVRCDGDQLEEIRICFSKDGSFRACGRDVRGKSCRRQTMTVISKAQLTQ